MALSGLPAAFEATRTLLIAIEQLIKSHTDVKIAVLLVSGTSGEGVAKALRAAHPRDAYLLLQSSTSEFLGDIYGGSAQIALIASYDHLVAAGLLIGSKRQRSPHTLLANIEKEADNLFKTGWKGLVAIRHASRLRLQAEPISLLEHSAWQPIQELLHPSCLPPLLPPVHAGDTSPVTSPSGREECMLGRMCNA
jgi:hypothetical protein